MIPKATWSENKRGDQPSERSSGAPNAMFSSLPVAGSRVSSSCSLSAPGQEEKAFCCSGSSHPQDLGEPRHENLS